MGKMTFVVDFPDGQEPAVSAGTDILGGKVEMVAWRDISEDNAWQRVEKCQPGPGVMVLLSDGVNVGTAFIDRHGGWRWTPGGEAVSESDLVLWREVPYPEVD
ncbi:hypothetical protein [Cedecea neteri]|uniref:DUF551 domain-containing protein n=1 Tax=Cedecea neteri TaxID=158822 RepID=A0A291DX65_9ENTR|nr:hypothetical protein [Cedecea neteri]ATF92394.1 hypothetical protein CO704_09995 [Cedecea neteri]